MTSVSAGHIILTTTQPVGSGRAQRESNPGPPHQESHFLPTELPRPRQLSITHTHTHTHIYIYICVCVCVCVCELVCVSMHFMNFLFAYSDNDIIKSLLERARTCHVFQVYSLVLVVSETSFFVPSFNSVYAGF